MLNGTHYTAIVGIIA